MNKNDVVKIMEVVISNPFFGDFVIKKSDNSIFYKDDYGFRKVHFWYYNSYDLERDALALEVQPNFDVRFNVLHKLFEKYSKRTLRDQRDDYSLGFTGGMLGTLDEFYFLENRKDYNKDLKRLCENVVNNSKRVFTNFQTLEDYYNYCINDVILGKREFPDEGFEWVTEYLIATKIVKPSSYDLVKTIILQRVEWMKGRKNPNIELYYNDIPTILDDLENTNFSAEKHGKILL
jgi:hypothetical protein